MPSVDIRVYCAKCDAGLCHKTRVEYGHQKPRLYIEPCECQLPWYSRLRKIFFTLFNFFRSGSSLSPE